MTRDDNNYLSAFGGERFKVLERQILPGQDLICKAVGWKLYPSRQLDCAPLPTHGP